MSNNPLVWIGLAGVHDDDNARAKHWQHRLHWIMVVVALLAVPTYILDTSESHPGWQRWAEVLDIVIFVAFLAETLWMLHVSTRPGRYLVENWLNLIVLLASLAAMLGASTGWIAVIRVLRAGIAGMFMLKIGAEFHILFTRRGAPLLVGLAVGTMLLGGGALWWLEPSVKTYWDGVWLAVVTASTVGYGDFYATTGAARVIAVFVMLMGFALVALFTANVVARFLGHEESEKNDQMCRDLAFVRERIEAMAADADAGAAGGHRALLAEVRALREDVAALAARIDAIQRGAGVARGRSGE